MLEQKRFYATSAFRTSANAYDPFTMEKFVHISGDTGTDDHMIDGVDMRYLGRLEDIAVYFQDRTSNNIPCWPYLEMIELDGMPPMSPKFDKRGLRKMQNVQKVIKAYRPDIVVKLVR
ncbi:hypothetical protein BGZ49_007145 [Haplosporangium sp. Z 27]|nr:hypothetical protein BGZ49_007145 [Haplosporangium sp. Z 27]